MPVVALVYLFLMFFISEGNSQDSQRFKAEPSDALVVKGQVVFLDCTIENLVGEVQWLRDGFGLGIGTEFEGFPRYKVHRNENLGEHTLVITNVQLEDDAHFQCQVGATESTQGLRSVRAKLTVQLPPDSVSIDEGSPVEVLVNTAHNLTCRASNAKPAPNITWFSNSEFIPDDVMTSYVVVTSEDGKRQNVTSSLTINPTKTDQGRGYECHAFNAAMPRRMWTNVTIEVIYPPEITITMNPSEQLKEFDSVSIVCNASANPPITEWRWFLGGKQIENKDRNSCVLDLPSINRNLHKKSVVCEAVNKAGNGQQSTTLDIMYGPVFTPPSEDDSADPGESAKLSCVVSSNPPSTIVWRKKGEMRILSSNATLSISEVTEDDFGVYTCTASMLGFEEVSQDMRLIKNGPPVIVSASEQSARYGEVGVIECIIDAIPKPTAIAWLRENKALDLIIHTRYKIREENTKRGCHSILEISNIQDEDFGTYNCSVDNGYGQTHQIIVFSKRVILPLPYILAIVLSGVVVIIILIFVTICFYRRRSSLGSEKASDSSECSITKHKDGMPDIRVEYLNGAVPTQQPYPGVIDQWNTDVVDPGHFKRHQSPFPYSMLPDDPLKWPRYQPPTHSNPYSINVHDIPAADIYGTYPRRPRTNALYGDNLYGPDMYGTLRGGLPPQYNVRPYSYIPQPASPSNSRLSTNV